MEDPNPKTKSPPGNKPQENGENTSNYKQPDNSIYPETIQKGPDLSEANVNSTQTSEKQPQASLNQATAESHSIEPHQADGVQFAGKETSLINFSSLHKIFINTLVISLILAASLAVISVLIGEFGELSQKALSTLIIVAVHALAGLAFIGVTSDHQSNLKYSINALFSFVVLSFITSVAAVWTNVSGEVIFKLYSTYLVLLFAVFHSEVLKAVSTKTERIKNIVFANYIFIVMTAALLLGFVWLDRGIVEGFYSRLLSASGIIDATLTLLAVIFYKLYLHDHPEDKDVIFSPHNSDTQKTHRGGFLRILLIIFGAYLIFNILFGILSLFFLGF